MKLIAILAVLVCSTSVMAANAAVVQKEGAKCAKTAEGQIARTADGAILVCKIKKWQKI